MTACPMTLRMTRMIPENTEKPKISKYLFEIRALVISVVSKIVIILLKHKLQ